MTYPKAQEDPTWISKLDEHQLSVALADAPPGSLHGLRVAVKDNIDVDGFPTTAGCASYGYLPERSATAVERLVSEGAVVLGKTNLDQFATGLVGTRSPYGAVPNPVRPGFISGGSSSGSAAAVASGEADIGVATDTAGSGRVPAALCGLVGLKGTRGWVPNTGVVPACWSFDCTTVMAADVTTAVAAMEAMVGPDRDDPMCRQRPAAPVGSVRTVGIPSPDALAGCSAEVSEAFAEALEALDRAGFETRQVDLEAYMCAAELLYGGSLVAERYAAVGSFLEGRPPDADPTVSTIILSARDLTAHAMATDRLELARLERRANEVWTQVDAIACPTVPFHPSLDEVEADPVGVNSALGKFVSGANLVDWCAAVLPIGGPGLQLLGPAWSDRALWQMAATLMGEALPSPEQPVGNAVAVAGAHLRGQPLNDELIERGARFDRTTRTAAGYRMVLLDSDPPKPGLHRDGASAGSIEVEIWELSDAGLGSLLASIPSPLGLGTVELADGSDTLGFLCEAEPVRGARDITSFGSWRSFLGSGSGDPGDPVDSDDGERARNK